MRQVPLPGSSTSPFIAFCVIAGSKGMGDACGDFCCITEKSHCAPSSSAKAKVSTLGSFTSIWTSKVRLASMACTSYSWADIYAAARQRRQRHEGVPGARRL
eukprot:2414315-Prymnesium_polylepis.1